MPTLIVDPVTLTATADEYGTPVATGYKRKHTHAVAFNSTVSDITLKIYLCPAAVAGANTNQILEQVIATKESYLCPEFIGSALAATGIMRAAGDGLTFEYVADDSQV